MMKVRLNMLSEQGEDAIDEVIQRTSLTNVISHFGQEAEMNTTNLQ